MKPPAPVRTAAPREVTLEVSGLSHDGRGVARRDGKTVFIAGALPGEQVRCRVTHAKARFDEARLLEVLHPSPERRAPHCPHFGHCGGCTLQHLSSAAQLAAHQQQLASALERIARLQPDQWLPPVPSEPFAYRARARLAVAWDAGARRVALGFRRGASRVVEPVTTCPVLAPAAGALIAPLAALIATLAAPGRVRELWLATGEPGLALGVACTSALDAPDRGRLEAFAAEHGAVLHLGRAAEDGSGPQWSEGGPPLRYATGPDGPVLEFQPWHFTQANRGVNRALIAAVLAQLAPAASDRVLDLFCGLGNFTLPLATRAAQLTGVEGDAALLDQARRNARANGLDNTEFLAADLAVAPAGAAWARARYDLVLLDPPRSGAAVLLPALARLGARRIAYVSCDAATLARDAAVLCARGAWSLTHAGVFDMFPQTSHFESLAVFAVRA
jgi:23S rRNA (uracil1939-C5)-methyltransferase